jgi:hypothetical protein
MTTKALNKRQWAGSMESMAQDEKKQRIEAPSTSKTAMAAEDDSDMIIEEGSSKAKRGPCTKMGRDNQCARCIKMNKVCVEHPDK